MKKLIITCVLLTSASMLSIAQNAGTPAAASKQPASMQQNNSQAAARPNQVTPDQLADRRAKIYQKQLGLNEEQTKKAHDIEMGFAGQELAFRNSGTQPSPGQMDQMNGAKEQQYKQVLTSDQFTKYQAMRPKTAPGAMPAAPSQPAAKH